MSTLATLATMNHQKQNTIVKFFEDQVMLKPEPSELLTMEDMDESKLPALNQLVNFIHGFYTEMKSVNIQPKEQAGQWVKSSYVLTDREFENFDRFSIRIQCELFDPEWTFALHAGFNFSLHIMQDAYQGRGEIADWITINISHLETVPSSLACMREHVKALSGVVGSKDCYFEDIPMEFTETVNFKRMSKAFSFKTKLFNQSIDDACKVMLKVASRKEFLKVVEEK